MNDQDIERAKDLVRKILLNASVEISPQLAVLLTNAIDALIQAHVLAAMAAMTKMEK